MQFTEGEDKDGVRMAWNIWPSTRIDASRIVVPVGTIYTPLKECDGLQRVEYDPVKCSGKNCGSILNPYCQVDFLNKIWVCPFCLTRNHFPHHYSDISPENLPAELINSFTTLEYIGSQIMSAPPVFVFVLDTCLIPEELQAAKTSLVQSLSLLPENCSVGLITFGKNVHVHQLGFQQCPKSFVFRGDPPKGKDLTVQKIADMLKLNGNIRNAAENSFLLPVADGEFILTRILEDLTPDSWPVKNGQRPARCTGVALTVAVSLLESIYQSQSGRVMLFTGGAPSVGPGRVVSLDQAEPIRSHRDIYKGNCPFYNAACKYYQDLALKCVENSHIVDIFACSLDQVGLAEMKPLAARTGGSVIVTESFGRKEFTETFQKVFQTDPEGAALQMTFGAKLEVVTSREFKVSGAIGPCTSCKTAGPCVSENELGEGGTCVWDLGCLTPQTSVAVYFDIVNTIASQIKKGQNAYIQFVTRFRHSLGHENVRVSTIAVPFAHASTKDGMQLLQSGFDQEAACCIMARLAVFKSEDEFAVDILRWLDRQLIKLVAKFATYTTNNPDSFRLSHELSYFPQFLFYLRRSQFLQVFNSSPDETAFCRMIIQRESVTTSLTMIQPTLISYSLETPPQPVLLDVSSRHPACILLLDTFFNVVVWFGENIAQWRDQGIQEQPDYAYFAEFLQQVDEDAESLMSSRIPRPMPVRCDQGTSQARFLVAKLNPSVSHNNPEGYGEGVPPPVFTDDVSLNVFMQHLRKLAVQPQ
eukprot:100355_1